MVTFSEVPLNWQTAYSEEMTSTFRVLSDIVAATSLEFLSDIC